MENAEPNEQFDEDILQDELAVSPQKAESTLPHRAKMEEAIMDEDDAEIPRLDLAEQILVEQRKVASIRRKKQKATSNFKNSSPISGTIGAIIHEAKKSTVERVEKSPEVEEAHKLGPSRFHIANQIVDMSSGARQIIADIVTRDIARLCGKALPRQAAWQSYTNN